MARLTLELFEQFGEVAPRERPFEGSSQGFVVPLDSQQPILDGGQGSEAVRRGTTLRWTIEK